MIELNEAYQMCSLFSLLNDMTVERPCIFYLYNNRSPNYYILFFPISFFLVSFHKMSQFIFKYTKILKNNMSLKKKKMLFSIPNILLVINLYKNTLN